MRRGVVGLYNEGMNLTLAEFVFVGVQTCALIPALIGTYKITKGGILYGLNRNLTEARDEGSQDFIKGVVGATIAAFGYYIPSVAAKVAEIDISNAPTVPPIYFVGTAVLGAAAGLLSTLVKRD